jgi:hypothetical protein
MTDVAAKRRFDRFWPRGAPYPPAAPWVASQGSRSCVRSPLLRVLQDESDPEVIASASCGEILLGVATGTLVLATAFSWWTTDDEEEKPAEDAKPDEAETEGEGGEGGGGFWDPDGESLDGNRPPGWW